MIMHNRLAQAYILNPQKRAAQANSLSQNKENSSVKIEIEEDTDDEKITPEIQNIIDRKIQASIKQQINSNPDAQLKALSELSPDSYQQIITLITTD